MIRPGPVPRWERAVALALLLALSPLLLVVGALVSVALGWPPLFVQERAGMHGRPFRMYKFRSMTNRRDNQGELLPDAERLTAFGRFLRATSLDELPELVNVVRGDMRFVGPRPLLLGYTRHYSPRQASRLTVPPGITGWAQINGRNDVTWEERLEMDAWYVDHRSRELDRRILAGTFGTVVSRRGLSQSGHATMERFDDGK